MQHVIVGRVVMIKYAGGSAYFTRTFSVPTDKIEGALDVGYTAWRVGSYNTATKELILHRESGKYEEVHFGWSSETNETVFQTLEITKVILLRHAAGYVPYNRPVQKTNTVVRTRPVETPKPIEFPKLRDVYPFSIEVAQLDFKNGRVTFPLRIPNPQTVVYCEVINPFVKEEFDSVKNYFAKFFDGKKVKGEIEVLHSANKILEKEVRSSDISSIREEMVHRVNEFLLEDFSARSDEDGIVTLTEVGNIFIGDEEVKTEMAVFQRLVQEGKTKHYHHLTYLSSLHAKDVCKLKVVGKLDSFAMVVRGGKHLFLVWEPYKNDYATYLWRLEENDLQQQLEEIEKIEQRIKWLKRGNKRGYQTEQKNNPSVCFIDHNYTLPLNGFIEWKEKVESFLANHSQGPMWWH